jgi:flavin-dependent dehydrogenase
VVRENDVFDVIVIGAGPVGEMAAARVVRGGLTAAVVEKRLVDGECNYYGCVHGAGVDRWRRRRRYRSVLPRDDP